MTAQLFVAALGASSYTCAVVTWTQGLSDWIGSHTRPFAFIGGAPAMVVSDYGRASSRLVSMSRRSTAPMPRWRPTMPTGHHSTHDRRDGSNTSSLVETILRERTHPGARLPRLYRHPALSRVPCSRAIGSRLQPADRDRCALLQLRQLDPEDRVRIEETDGSGTSVKHSMTSPQRSSTAHQGSPPRNAMMQRRSASSRRYRRLRLNTPL
jgi:hypothetical protein